MALALRALPSLAPFAAETSCLTITAGSHPAALEKSEEELNVSSWDAGLCGEKQTEGSERKGTLGVN